MEGFNRQETIDLTGASSNDLSYWDRSRFISPAKIGNPKHPVCIYSVDQVIRVAIALKLRQVLSSFRVKQVVNSIDSLNCKFFDSTLLVAGSKLFILKDPEELNRIKSIFGLIDQGSDLTFRSIGTLSDVLPGIRANAEKHGVLDFDKRVVGTVLEQKDVLAA